MGVATDEEENTRPSGEGDFRLFFESEYARLGRALYLVTGSASEAE